MWKRCCYNTRRPKKTNQPNKQQQQQNSEYLPAILDCSGTEKQKAKCKEYKETANMMVQI